jgi:hypothetical protein
VNRERAERVDEVLELAERYFRTHADLVRVREAVGTQVVSSRRIVGTNPGLIAPGDLGRRSLLVSNLDAANPIYLGGDSVGVGDGFPLEAGATITLYTVAAVYAVAAAPVAAATMAETGAQFVEQNR